MPRHRAYRLGVSTPNQPNQPQSPPVAAPLPRFNVMAIIAFVAGFVVPVAGIVCGHIALAEFRKGLPERGREYALAGLILGYVFTAIWVVIAIIWVVFLFTHFAHAGVGYRGPVRPVPMPTLPIRPNN
jgi:hypothetical protein